MKKIILVRHGEALGNSTGELMGCRIGSNLTEKGKKQTDMVADYLIKNYNIDNFYSSPASRAIETADIINKKLGIKYIVNQYIKEIDFGDMTGKKISEIPKEIDLEYMKDPFFHKHTGGENMSDLFKRVGKFLNEEIYNSTKNEILIVTHDNIIKAFTGVLNGITKEVIYLKIGNCSIVEYNISENKIECVNFNLSYYLN